MMDKVRDIGQDKLREQVRARITPSEEPLFRAIVDVATSHELQQARAISYALDVAGVEDVGVYYNREQRSQQLLDIADAMTDDRFEDWWLSQCVEKPDVAEQYLGLDGEEWADQLREWYRMFYENDVVDEPIEDAEPGYIGHVADRHIRQQFGVSLRQFVATVVNYQRERILDDVLSSQTQVHTQMTYRLAEEIKQRDQRIEELEEQVESLQS